MDKAVLGSEKSIWEPIYELRPDIVALGYDQLFDDQELSEQLRMRGFNIEVVRITSKRECPLCSSASIVRDVLKKRKLEEMEHGQDV